MWLVGYPFPILCCHYIFPHVCSVYYFIYSCSDYYYPHMCSVYSFLTYAVSVYKATHALSGCIGNAVA